jgi:hypothetical protein
VRAATNGGRLVAMVLMLCGIGFVAVLTATVAAHFVENDGESVTEELHRLNERLERIEQLLASAGRDEAARQSTWVSGRPSEQDTLDFIDNVAGTRGWE